jgi:hypothetical protein
MAINHALKPIRETRLPARFAGASEGFIPAPAYECAPSR